MAGAGTLTTVKSTEWDWELEDLGFLSQAHPTSLGISRLTLGHGGLSPGSLAPSLLPSLQHRRSQTPTQPTVVVGLTLSGQQKGKEPLHGSWSMGDPETSRGGFSRLSVLGAEERQAMGSKGTQSVRNGEQQGET